MKDTEPMWCGVPLSQMSREDLMAALIELAQMLDNDRRRHADELRRLAGLA